MALTQANFVLYDQQYDAGTQETLAQNINVFNANSANAITLASEQLAGDYRRGRYFKTLTSSNVSRRDPTTMGDRVSTGILQGELISVNVCRKLGPLEQTLDSWRAIARDPATLSLILGQDGGNAKAQEMLNAIIMCLAAGLKSIGSSVIYDPTAVSGETTTMITKHLAKGLGKLGDASSRIVAWVMHSKVHNDLVVSQITDKITGIANVVVYGGSPASMNRPVIVTDSDSLVYSVSGQTDVYYTLGLVAGAGGVVQNNASDAVLQIVTGRENITGRFEEDYRINLGVRGMKWDTSGGGANPENDALADEGNWIQSITSYKDGPGVLIKTY